MIVFTCPHLHVPVLVDVCHVARVKPARCIRGRRRGLVIAAEGGGPPHLQQVGSSTGQQMWPACWLVQATSSPPMHSGSRGLASIIGSRPVAPIPPSTAPATVNSNHHRPTLPHLKVSKRLAIPGQLLPLLPHNPHVQQHMGPPLLQLLLHPPLPVQVGQAALQTGAGRAGQGQAGAGRGVVSLVLCGKGTHHHELLCCCQSTCKRTAAGHMQYPRCSPGCPTVFCCVPTPPHVSR